MKNIKFGIWRHVFCLSILAVSWKAVADIPWSVTLETTNLSFAGFEFGTANGATVGWDPALEDPLPPALPSGAISGFSVNGAPFPFITLQNFRAIGTHHAVFGFIYSLPEGATAILDWSADQGSAPIGDIVINSAYGTNLLGGDNTMADVRSLELKASRDGVSTIYFILGNPRPVARDDVAYMLNLSAGSTVGIDVLANDYSPALSPLEVVDALVAVPANGAATVLTPPDMINYAPNFNFFGVDAFQYQATDGVSDSEAATVTVYVNENVVLHPRADQEPGKPGEEVSVTVDVETNPLLDSLALQIVLPRTNQNPSQIWGFVGATYDDGGRGAAEVPSVHDDGMGTVTLGFASRPTSLTLTLAVPDERVASSPIVFDKAAATVAELETDAFPDALLGVKVSIQTAALEIAPEERTHTYAAQDNQTFAVSANVPWTAGTEDDWILIVDGQTGDGDGTVTYAVAANPGVTRGGEIAVEGGGLTRVFAMHQKGGTVDIPVFDPPGGIFAGDAVAVTVTCATEGATIRYTMGEGTTPGADPIEAAPEVPADGIVEVPVPGWLKARTWKDGMATSEIVSAVYHLEDTPPRHPADGNEDGRIDLFEYLDYAGPVAAVYQRGINGGEYDWDGTTLVPVTAGRGTRGAHGPVAALEEVNVHPADANADGRIDLFEYLTYAGPVAAVYQRGINGGEYDWDGTTLTPRTNALRSVGIGGDPVGVQCGSVL